MEKILKIGIIGIGGRIRYMINVESAELKGTFKVTAIADPDTEKAKSIAKEDEGYYADDVAIYSDADEMLDNEELDGVMIGTRCNLHTEMAVKVIERGIPLFLEKPVSISLEQVKILNEARKKYDHKVVVSFPLKTSNIVRIVKDMIDSGKIGKIENVQAFNDVEYGRVYQHGWYRDTSITGGMWLQKATHDLDYLDYIIGGQPTEICAMDSHTLFKGDMPVDLRCIDCDKQDTCPESPKYRQINNRDDSLERSNWDSYYCCFSDMDTPQDAGSAIVRYDNGTFVSYNQNFFVRNRAGRRGANFYGYKGTISFDFKSSNIVFYSHGHDIVETTNVAPDTKSAHFGGDVRLIRRFHDMMRGKDVPSMLGEGIKSALTCCLAEKSSREAQFIKIPNIDEI